MCDVADCECGTSTVRAVKPWKKKIEIVQIIRLLVMQFSPLSYHFRSIRLQFSPQRPVL